MAADEAGAAGDGAKPGRLKRVAATVKTRSSGKVAASVLALLMIASLALFGALYWFSYRPDRATDAAAAKAAIAAASEGTVAVLSYSPDTLDRDFSSAKSHLTGDFLSYYDQFTQQIVAPAAKQKSVKTTAVVLRAAMADLRPDSAEVLLFVNQSTQSKDRPEPTFTNSSVSVKLTKANGKWLISSFNPV
ncbi:twin-arginine translocation pathway signal [Mycobacterium alsense]|uniref:Twin-arginine translocation pathway signal n=1 Tax=Mycobacterium alsense TaxID=324058 RepID=A0ABX3RGY7_9MYCO|nr:twin-arginine translocation pathway signal [Mycobacterium alsense]